METAYSCVCDWLHSLNMMFVRFIWVFARGGRLSFGIARSIPLNEYTTLYLHIPLLVATGLLLVFTVGSEMTTNKLALPFCGIHTCPSAGHVLERRTAGW